MWSEHLWDDEHVWHQCRLQHDRHVWGIEELDEVRSPLTIGLVALNGDLNAESLEVDDDGKNNNHQEQAHDVRKPLLPEGLMQRTTFIMPREQEVEQCNDGTFKLISMANIDGGRGKGLPDDGLTDIGGNKKVDAGSETVTFLSSSRRVMMRAAMMSWMIRRRQTLAALRSLGWLYKMVWMYMVTWLREIMRVNSRGMDISKIGGYTWESQQKGCQRKCEVHHQWSQFHENRR